MQLRMLARRSLSGSMTVVGDIAQATGAWSPSSWDEVLTHLPRRRTATTVELTVNYRTPAEVMEVAGRVLAAFAPHLKPPRSVRTSGELPLAIRFGTADLGAGAVAEAARLQAEIGGTVAVICPPSLFGAVAEAAGGQAEVSLEAPVSVIPVGTVKGLEFDGVVVVEPALIVEESPQGLRALYVSLTRPTKRLVLAHCRPLPPVIATAPLTTREALPAAAEVTAGSQPTEP